MTDPITFFAVGLPRAQPRPRAYARRMGARFVARVYSDDAAAGWKTSIALAARPHIPRTPLTGPLRVDLTVYFPRPQRMLTKKWPDGPILHDVKPDRDNVDKAILDSLTDARMWGDDSQVCAGEVRKYYAARGGATGAQIRIEPAT